MSENSDDQSVTSRVKIFGVVVASLLVLFGSGAVFAYLSGWKLNMDAAPTAVVEQGNDKTPAPNKSGSDSSATNNDSNTKQGQSQSGFFGFMGRLVSQAGKTITVGNESSTGEKGSVQLLYITQLVTPRNGAQLNLASLELQLANNFIPGSTLRADKKQVIAPGEGTYRTTTAGAVQYSPELSYIGSTVGVQFSVQDTSGTTYKGLYKPRVIDTAPKTCSDPRSQNFWLAKKMGTFHSIVEGDVYRTTLQELTLDESFVRTSSNGNVVLAVDRDRNILTSNDGGENWLHVGPDEELPLYDVELSGDGRVMVVRYADGNGNRTTNGYRSIDGGVTWSNVILPIGQLKLSRDGSTMYSLSSAGDRRLQLSKSTDFGASWQLLTTTPDVAPAEPSSGMGSVYGISNDGQTIMAGATPKVFSDDGSWQLTIIRSSDGGQSWETHDPSTDDILYPEMKVSADGQSAFMLLTNNTNSQKEVFTSSDSGHSWQLRASPEDVHPISLDLARDSGRLVLHTNTSSIGFGESTLYTSDNAGVTWTAVSLPDIYGFYQPFTISANGLVVYTSLDGEVYRSNNGGQSWASSSMIYQPFNEYRVDLDLSTPESEYVLDKTETEGWRLSYDPATDELLAIVTDGTKFTMGSVLRAEYSLSPLSHCADPVTGHIEATLDFQW